MIRREYMICYNVTPRLGGEIRDSLRRIICDSARHCLDTKCYAMRNMHSITTPDLDSVASSGSRLMRRRRLDNEWATNTDTKK